MTEDALLLLLKEHPAELACIQKSFIRLKDVPDYIASCNARSRIWRRFVRQYLTPMLASKKRMNQVQSRYMEHLREKLEEKMQGAEKVWAADELSTSDESDDEKHKKKKSSKKK